MTRVAIDSNIVIYAEIEPDSAKGVRAGARFRGEARS
jgi:predicted nucleic acid-binding protein